MVKISILNIIFLLFISSLYSQCPINTIQGSVSITSDTTWQAGIYMINGDFLVGSNITLTISGYNSCPFSIDANNITVLGTINANGAGGAGGTGGIAGTGSGGVSGGGASLPGGGSGGSAGSGNGGGTAGNNGGDASGGCALSCGLFNACVDGNDADRAGGGGGAGGAGGSFGGAGGSGAAGAAGRFENEPGNSDCSSTPVAGSGSAAPNAAAAYDNTGDSADLQAGSGGGGAGGGGGGLDTGTTGGNGGNGGGTVNLNAQGNLVMSGLITANGTNGGSGGNGGIRSGTAANWNCETCSNSDLEGENDCRFGPNCTVCTYFTWVWPGGAGGGAGGGSGGGIKLQALGVMTVTGIMDANGGNGGNAGHPWQSDASCNNYAGGGGAGAGGVIKYVYNPCAANVFTPGGLSVVAGTPGNGTDGNQGTNTAQKGVIFNQQANIYYPGYQAFSTPAISSNQTICPGGQLNGLSSSTVTGGTGSYNYQWYFSTKNPTGQSGSTATPAANWFPVINGGLPSLSSDTIGSITNTTYYQLQVQSGPCYVWSNVVTISVQAAPTITNATATNVLCSYDSNGTITIIASGGTPSYMYSIDSGLTYQTSNVFNNLQAGHYYAFVEDTNSCSSGYALNAVVVGSTPPIVETVQSTNATCIGLHNGSIHASATGGTSPYYFSLNGGGSQSSGTFSSKEGAIYYVRVFDSNGCFTAQMVTVADSQQLVTYIDSIHEVSCSGQTNGSVQLATNGGTAPYLYSINDGNYTSTNTYSGLAAGNYTINLHDNRGCTNQYIFSITQPDSLQLAIDTLINGTCSGGSISINTSGGTTPYTFMWSNGGSSRFIDKLNTGTYKVTATDANGCSDSLSASIVSPAVFSAITSSRMVSCYNHADGSAALSVSGNTGPFTFYWDNGSNDSTISDIAAGNYTVTVNDANHCSQSYTIQISQPSQIQAVFESNNPDCAGGNNGSANVGVTGGIQPYSYSWSNGAASDSISQLAAGIYTLTITDSLQCTALASVALSEPLPLVVSVSALPATGGNANGSAIIDTIEGGVSPYTIQWSDGETGRNDLKLAGGKDTLTVTDNNGCSQTYIITIPEVTGINAVESLDFAIYPNPAISSLIVDIYQSKQQSVISIKNVLGQTLLNRNTSASHNEFDISDFSAGLYLVEIIQGGKKAVKQIVVSR